MNVAETLKRAARSCHEERDLPTDLYDKVCSLADVAETLDPALLSTLMQQLEEYDPYAGVGCFCEGTTLSSLKETVSRLEE